MPHYRLVAKAMLQQPNETSANLRQAGEEIVFDGEPGISMMPLDSAAYAAKAASIRKWGWKRGRGPTQLGEDRPQAIVLPLARSLGAAEGISFTAAVEFVDRWLDSQS